MFKYFVLVPYKLIMSPLSLFQAFLYTHIYFRNLGLILSKIQKSFIICLTQIPCEEMSTANLKALRNSPQLLLEEETEEYYKSLHYSDQDLLTAVQNATVYSKSVMQTIEIVCTPMIHNLELQLKGKRRTVDQLKETLRLLEERKRDSGGSGVGEMNTSMEVT